MKLLTINEFSELYLNQVIYNDKFDILVKYNRYLVDSLNETNYRMNKMECDINYNKQMNDFNKMEIFYLKQYINFIQRPDEMSFDEWYLIKDKPEELIIEKRNKVINEIIE